MAADSLIAFILLGSFLASLLGSTFGVGSGIVILLFISHIFPLTTVVPLFAACMVGIDFVRFLIFRNSVAWSIVRPFVLGALVGIAIGSRVYFSMPEWLIGTAIAVIMLSTLWLPSSALNFKVRHPFLFVGFFHALISTMFAFGGLFQAAISRAKLEKYEVIGTIAVSFWVLTMMKVVGYASYGFDYRPFLTVIFAGLVGSVPGTFLGKKIAGYVPDKKFTFIFKLIVTLFAIRLFVIAVF